MRKSHSDTYKKKQKTYVCISLNAAICMTCIFGPRRFTGVVVVWSFIIYHCVFTYILCIFLHIVNVYATKLSKPITYNKKIIIPKT